MAARKHVIIIGAGFAGLYAARTLAKSKEVQVTLIDRNNFHTFTPLLYQVATCALEPSSIAYPIRSIFRKNRNVDFLMGDVKHVDYNKKVVEVNGQNGNRRLDYDYLILATGSVTNHFGQESIARYSYSLKDIDDAVALRHHILTLFERAAWITDTATRDAMTTMVVVGGGPTGLETAGALYELYNDVLKKEYSNIEPRMRSRVILLEAQDRLLLQYPPRLQEAALRQLESLGVEVMLNAMVDEVTPTQVRLKDGRVIHTHTMIWAAGVKASPMGEDVDVSLQKAGRVPVKRTMEVIGRDGLYAAGDLTYLEDENGKPYPMLIPVAKQQGILAAKNIMRLLNGEEQRDFTYSDRGVMATIGRSRAVAWIFYRIQVTGFLAWLSWLFLHLVVLLGFRNRLSVFINWVWNYVTYDRSVRIVMQHESRLRQDHVQASQPDEEKADKAKDRAA